MQFILKLGALFKKAQRSPAPYSKMRKEGKQIAKACSYNDQMYKKPEEISKWLKLTKESQFIGYKNNRQNNRVPINKQ